MYQVDSATLELFNGFLVNIDKPVMPYPRKKEFEENALNLGVVVAPSVQLSDSRMYLLQEKFGMTGEQMNQAFHKSWDTILNTPESDLIAQQILHYFTTYGFEAFGIYDEKLVYIPDEVLEVPELENLALTKIFGLTREVIIEQIIKLSELPLSKNAINNIFVLFTEIGYSTTLVPKIKNKELRTKLMDHYGIAPTNPEEFLRYMVYKLTGETLIIKNQNLIQKLRLADSSTLSKLIKEAPKNLASVFYRYRTLFLAMKHASTKKDKVFFNQLRRDAETMHVPAKRSYLLTVTEQINLGILDIDVLESKLKGASFEQLVKLINALYYRANMPHGNLAHIRNGKQWAYKLGEYNEKSGLLLYAAIAKVEQAIASLMGNKLSKVFYIPEGIDYAIPVSEKRFISNIPMGTKIAVSGDDVVIGVHWYNDEHKRIDLDLSILDASIKIGFGGGIRESDSILWSGDMTDAPLPNGASELVYIKSAKQMQRLLSMRLNYYNGYVGNDPAKYTFFIGRDKYRRNSRFVINPNNVLFKLPFEIEKEQSLGTIEINQGVITVTLDASNTGTGRSVSRFSEYTQIEQKYHEIKSASDLRLDYLINMCGGVILHERPDEGEYIDLSPESLTKTTLLDLIKD